ncbi:hypothetical protein CAOG_00230 [Capsaspora owczarzaki ATCC 30864]|uniref:hypothetical protein n=1 Tax=Capsaspora owczarzaki (strain ATCC 30864) TaxID=595528 RepID=UPI0001FE3679|nr:hypothetical protein CAOG_00230 [Capsaspora owczarzaki ATCC 30864]|eukprot:XP_004365101.1 hypothetical protein CAOG_00230 [Capsaspora owczarzaki ATCC 30864]
MLLATTGANAGAVDSALPPPVPAAKLLRTTALRSLNAWNATFGTAYRKLALACDFLSNQLKINLRDPDSSSMTQREIRERTTAMRNQQVLELRLRTLIDDELEGRLDEVRETLRETNAVIELLVPSIDGATGSGNVSSASGASHLTDPQLTARAHGLGSSHYQLEVALDGRALQIRRTTDNKALIATITDACKLIESRHLPFIASYIDLLVQVGEAALDSHATQHSRLRAAIDVKRELQAMLDKAHELEFVGAEPLPPVDQEDGNEDEAQIAVHLERDDFNDDDWVSGKRSRDDDSVDEEDADDQVQEEAAEAAAPSVATDSVVSTANAPSNPTVIATPKPTTAGRVVVAGSTVPIPNINAMDTAHRFWGNRDSDDLMSDVPSAMREVLETSVVTYQQEPLEPVKWACRAPLGKAGRLCKRMDREVCPFHGRIVPRDESGNPTDPKFLEELEKRRYADALVAASAISASGSVKVAGQRMTAAAKVKRAKLEAPGVALGRAAPGAEAGGELTARKDDADRLFERDTATVQALRAGHSALDVALAHALTTNAPGSERVNREWMGLERDILSSPAVAGTLASQKPKPRLTDISDASSSVSSSSSSSGGGGSSKRDPVASFEARMRKGNASRRAILDRMEAQEDKARRDQFGDFWQYRE